MTNHCGYIAIIGRPNVGKSTLLNQLIQQKLSITSRKPQTTRHSILGIRTDGDYQYVYVDTPGIQKTSKKILNRVMNKTAMNVLNDVDAIVFVTDGTHWQEEDEYVFSLIAHTKVPCFLVINKVDKITDKAILLPWIENIQHRYAFAGIIPLSAKTGSQVDTLHACLQPVLPQSPHLFPDDQLTDRSLRFLCAELLREKIFRMCGQELPYSTIVDIESYKEERGVVHIHALILVDKSNHKRMIIGNKGAKMKEMASSARMDMEKLLSKPVFLQCWCKVKAGWADDERLLQQLGL